MLIISLCPTKFQTFYLLRLATFSLYGSVRKILVSGSEGLINLETSPSLRFEPGFLLSPSFLSLYFSSAFPLLSLLDSEEIKNGLLDFIDGFTLFILFARLLLNIFFSCCCTFLFGCPLLNNGFIIPFLLSLFFFLFSFYFSFVFLCFTSFLLLSIFIIYITFSTHSFFSSASALSF